ncbi:hypothetical protein [Lysobacter gummosus]|uniref:hypothetical protein n=1 Tax=Lysobacter gummosus TaxID=262324 RepID=UPI0036418B00
MDPRLSGPCAGQAVAGRGGSGLKARAPIASRLAFAQPMFAQPMREGLRASPRLRVAPIRHWRA